MKDRMNALFCAFHAKDRMLRFLDDFPEINWTVTQTPAEAAAAIGMAHIVVLNNRICTPELGAALRSSPSPDLLWIHFITAGVERGLAMGLPPGVPVTNAAGANGPALAEHAFALLLGCMRRFNDIFQAQAARSWRRLEISAKMRGLEGSRVCIIGLGAVGREIARKLRAFDVDVIAISRSGNDSNVSAVYPRERLCEAFHQSDAVIVCTNSDPSSYHLIGEAEIAALKPGSFIVNVARGEIIDENALIESLKSGHIAGAGLDVTEEEPLPPDNSLWTLPCVILSPHVAGGGAGEGGYRRQKDLFAANLQRLEKRQTLLSLVDTASTAQVPVTETRPP